MVKKMSGKAWLFMNFTEFHSVLVHYCLAHSQYGPLRPPALFVIKEQMARSLLFQPLMTFPPQQIQHLDLQGLPSRTC